MRQEIDWSSVFQNLANITGLPLRFERGKWYGACYLNGEAHCRWNKTVAYVVKDGIRILEQGGENLSLLKWLLQYGGCHTWAEAFERIRSGSSWALPVRNEVNTWVEPPLKYVPNGEVGICQGECALKKFLSVRFGVERVSEVWDRYRVGSKVLRSGEIATVFWYIDKEGRCCHDKVMLYGENGRRSKEYGGGRRFKVGDGYRGRSYFGSHLLGGHNGRIAVVESEKSALIMSLAHPDTLWLATGGASMLREVGRDWKLWRDFDSAGLRWQDMYPNQSVKWWEVYSDVEKGMDIADIILRDQAF